MVKILLADDHAMIRRGLRALLEQQSGWLVVAEATNGREAIELAALHQPHVAVLDIAMPELNGLDAARGIRRDSPGTEVLVFTMVDSTALIRHVLATGARGYLLKSEMDRFVIDAVEALAAHRPYFSSAISGEILDGYLRAGSTDARGSEPLTPREREIAQMIAESRSNKMIALRCGISIKTVETHRTTLMRKIGARSVADVVRYAIRNNISAA